MGVKRYKVNDVDAIFIPDPVLPPSNSPYAYVVQPSAPNAGTFATISAAIAAAVVDGASSSNPKVVLIEGGTYTESFTLPDGVFLQAAGGLGAVAGQGSVTLIDSEITVAANAENGINGIAMTTSNGNPIINGSAAANTFLILENCDIEQIGGGTGIVFNGTLLQVIDSVVQGLWAIDVPAGQMIVERCTLLGIGSGGINIGSGVTFAAIAFSEVDSVGGPCVAIAGSVSTTSVNILQCFIGQFDPSSNGIDIAAAAGTAVVTVAYVLFTVLDGGTNRAIDGNPGVSLYWGGVTFLPGTTNRVATTTIGGTAIEMVIDNITAV